MHLLFLLGILLSVHHYSRTNAFKDYYWRDYTIGDTPDDALQIVPDVLIGQVTLLGSNLVASIYPNQRKVLTYSFGRKEVSQNIRILCSRTPDHFYWEFVSSHNLKKKKLADAVKGGFNNYSRADLFIGKSHNTESWIVSSICNSKGGLWIWKPNGDSFKMDQFHILKYNSSVNSVVDHGEKGCCKGGCCKGSCKESCKGSCKESCKGSCKESCKGSCKKSCKGGCCKGSCKGSCKGKCCKKSCKGSCKGRSCKGACKGCSKTTDSSDDMDSELWGLFS